MFNRSLKIATVVAPATITTTTTHTYFDLGGLANNGSFANREMKLIWSFGSVAGTTPSITVSVQECDTTNGTYAAPDGITSPTAVTTNGFAEVNFFPAKRYIQAVTTYTANTTSANVGVVALVVKRDDQLA